MLDVLRVQMDWHKQTMRLIWSQLHVYYVCVSAASARLFITAEYANTFAGRHPIAICSRSDK